MGGVCSCLSNKEKKNQRGTVPAPQKQPKPQQLHNSVNTEHTVEDPPRLGSQPDLQPIMESEEEQIVSPNIGDKFHQDALLSSRQNKIQPVFKDNKTGISNEIVYTDPMSPPEGSYEEQLTERGGNAEEQSKPNQNTLNIFNHLEEKKSDANMPGETPQFPPPKQTGDKKIFSMRHQSAELEPEVIEYEESKKQKVRGETGQSSTPTKRAVPNTNLTEPPQISPVPMLEDSAAKLRLPVLKHDINQPIMEEPSTPNSSNKQEHSSANQSQTKMTPDVGSETKALSKIIDRPRDDNQAIPKTPANVISGEMIAEESQPPSCQNTVIRKQDTNAGLFQTPTETPVRKPGQETQMHKLEPLNQPDDLMEPDAETELAGTKIKAVELPHNIEEKTFTSHIENSNLIQGNLNSTAMKRPESDNRIQELEIQSQLSQDSKQISTVKKTLEVLYDQASAAVTPNELLNLCMFDEFDVDREKKLRQFATEIIKSEDPFTDESFPPNQSSLCDEAQLKESGFQNIVWKRLSEIYPKHSLFSKMSIDDALSGKSGDSFFVAVLASIVNQKDRIKNLFIHPTNRVNASGIYIVQLYVNGKLQPIVVDDYIPVEAETSQPVFCKSINKEIWAIILEKAWAKLNRNYARSSSVFPNYASIALTGVPAEYFQHSLEVHESSGLFNQGLSDKFWALLQELIKSKHTLVANGSLSVDDDKLVAGKTWGSIKKRVMSWEDYEKSIEFKQVSNRDRPDIKRLRDLEEASKTIGCIKEKGLANKHAYPVMELIEFEMNSKAVRLVRIQKTPGAEGEWSGDWSRQSDLWTPELREKYLSKLAENEFFVPYEIYKSWFKGTMVNLDQHDQAYEINNISLDMSQDYDAFFEFELKHPIDTSKDVFTLMCEQKGKSIQDYCQKQGQIDVKPEQEEVKAPQQPRRRVTSTLSGKDQPESSQFEPSKFSLMLIKVIDERMEKFELVDHLFTSHLKLLLRVQSRTLPEGKYLVMVAPLWNSSAVTDQLKNITLGIYAPVKILDIRQIRKKSLGYTALTKIYCEIAAKKNTYESFHKVYGTKAPEDYAKQCFRDVSEDPLPGVHGYISLKNRSPFELAMWIKVQFQGAFMVHPEKSTQDKFQAAIQEKENELYIFRKTHLSLIEHDIQIDFVPRRLETEELYALVKNQTPITKGINVKAYKFYESKDHSTKGFLFENRQQEHVMTIKGSLKLQNMFIRGGGQGSNPQIDEVVLEKDECLIILDAIDRNKPTNVQLQGVKVEIRKSAAFFRSNSRQSDQIMPKKTLSSASLKESTPLSAIESGGIKSKKSLKR